MLNTYIKLKELINELKNKIPMKNTSISNVNCNDYTETGIYYLGSSVDNAPEDYCKLLVMGTSSGKEDTFQLASGITTGKMYTRTGRTKSGTFTWQDWKKITQDFEMKSGIWTPKITTIEGTAPTVTYSIQEGNYRKIGDLVYIDFYIRGTITKLNGSNNYTLVTGVPYIFKNAKFGQVALNLGVCYNLLEDNPIPQLLGLNDSYAIRVQANLGTAATKLKTSGNIGYFELGGSGVYRTN